MRPAIPTPAIGRVSQRQGAATTTQAGGLPLAANDVNVWRVQLDSQTDQTVEWLESLLSPDELDRAERFYFARDRRRYVTGRGILRVILGRYLGRLPGELEFVYGRNGKPRLIGREIHFNVAHSEELALLAFTRVGEVGVDVERIRDLPDCDEVAQSAFSMRELAKLKAHPPERRQSEFFHAWARQEAVLKALGTGLSDVKGTDVEHGFAVYPLKVDEGYAAALAVAASGAQATTILGWDQMKRSDGRSASKPGIDFNFT